LLDHGLKHFSEIVEKHFPGSTEFPGAGAAGGLPVSAKAFLHATHERGIDFYYAMGKPGRKIEQADWIFTGEGKF